MRIHSPDVGIRSGWIPDMAGSIRFSQWPALSGYLIGRIYLVISLAGSIWLSNWLDLSGYLIGRIYSVISLAGSIQLSQWPDLSGYVKM